MKQPRLPLAANTECDRLRRRRRGTDYLRFERSGCSMLSLPRGCGCSLNAILLRNNGFCTIEIQIDAAP